MVSSLRSEGLPLVNKSQAQAGPRFYYSDLRFGVGRCFSFLYEYIANTFFEAKLCNGDLLKFHGITENFYVFLADCRLHVEECNLLLGAK